MAYVAPSTRATGFLVDAATWNQDVVANPTAIYGGAISVPSQVALDFIYASTASQLARVAAAAGKAPRMNAAGTAWEMVPLSCELLKANSGTDTNASAATVDTYAMASGLTAKDTVLVEVTIEAITQAVATPLLYNTTDSVARCNLITLAAGEASIHQCYIRQAKSAATKVLSNPGFGAGVANTTVSTFVTAWTGAWTLGLRHGGVTAGGTFHWSWAVYVLRGQ